MDEFLDNVRVGEIGELCISGICLSTGYLNNSDITNSKFIENPHNYDNIFFHSKLYRTGDLVLQLADGNIMYVGRKDGQVKLRGIRIELGEIENALMFNTEVFAAVVLYHDLNDRSFLSGHVVLSQVEQENYNEHQLNAYLEKRLPEYMIHSYIIVHNRFPTTINGKTDKEQLRIFFERRCITQT